MDKKTQGLVEQYAKGLTEVAFEQDALSAVREDISQILAVFEETDLNTFLRQENVSPEVKQSAVSLFQESCSVYMNNFLEVILLNERTELLYAILNRTLELFNQKNNEYDVTVVSSLALTEDQKRRLLALAAQKFDIKPHRLIEEVDDSLIGGFVVKAKNKVIDTSIRRQLQAFKLNLK